MHFLILLLVPAILAQRLQPRHLRSKALSNLERISAFAGASYCSENYAKDPKKVILPDNSYIRSSAAQVSSAFVDISDAETTGLIMWDRAREQTVISFRGTASSEDWQTNLEFFLDDDANDICGSGCLVHAGFLESWSGARDAVLKGLNNLPAKQKKRPIVVTGHSLGGALAQLCAAELKRIAPRADISLYTYGSPRVGNDVFASFIENSIGHRNYRVTHLNDPVPRLPGRFFGYVHAGPEYYIRSPYFPDVTSANKSVLTKPGNMAVGPKDLLVFTGPENEGGNVGHVCTDVAMHDEYFLHIADCAAPRDQSLLVGE